MWAMVISVGPPLLGAELMRRTDLTWSLIFSSLIFHFILVLCRASFDISFISKVTEREWKKRVFNFDSLPHAMLTLFSSLTGEGWPT